MITVCFVLGVKGDLEGAIRDVFGARKQLASQGGIVSLACKRPPVSISEPLALISLPSEWGSKRMRRSATHRGTGVEAMKVNSYVERQTESKVVFIINTMARC